MKLLPITCLCLLLQSASAQLLEEKLTVADEGLKGKPARVQEKMFLTDDAGKKKTEPKRIEIRFYNHSGYLTNRVDQQKEFRSTKWSSDTTKFLYDQRNRLSKVEYPDAPDYNEVYTYREEGSKLFRLFGESGNYVLFTYNKSKELIKYERYESKASKPSEAWDYTWKNGLVIEIKHSVNYIGTSSTRTIKYDDRNNPVEIKETERGVVTKETTITYNNFDSQNNWQQRTETTKDLFEDKHSIIITERTISYH